MAEIDTARAQIEKIKEILIKADEKLLAGEITEDIYRQITQGKLELLKTLESRLPPQKPAGEIQKDLEELIERAKKRISYAKEDNIIKCGICSNDLDYNNCYMDVRIREHDLAFGFYCKGVKNPRFEAQGYLPLPKYIQEYLEETGYFEEHKEG